MMFKLSIENRQEKYRTLNKLEFHKRKNLTTEYNNEIQQSFFECNTVYSHYFKESALL